MLSLSLTLLGSVLFAHCRRRFLLTISSFFGTGHPKYGHYSSSPYFTITITLPTEPECSFLSSYVGSNNSDSHKALECVIFSCDQCLDLISTPPQDKQHITFSFVLLVKSQFLLQSQQLKTNVEQPITQDKQHFESGCQFTNLYKKKLAFRKCVLILKVFSYFHHGTKISEHEKIK